MGECYLLDGSMLQELFVRHKILEVQRLLLKPCCSGSLLSVEFPEKDRSGVEVFFLRGDLEVLGVCKINKEA